MADSYYYEFRKSEVPSIADYTGYLILLARVDIAAQKLQMSEENFEPSKFESKVRDLD